MENQYLLSPYFLDRPLPQLEAVAGAEWQVMKPALPAGETQERMSVLYKQLADEVTKILQTGNRPVIVAGDCCTAIGVTAGVQRADLDPILIWFDAHGDFNTWETSPSGFLGGMPLSMLVGRGEQTLLTSLGMKTIREDHVVLSDGRDLDPAEREALFKSKVTHLPDVTQLLNHPLPDAPIHVHFDVDVIDASEAPAMSYAALGGPSTDDLMRVFRYLAGTGRVKVVSMSSWNPALDPKSQTQNLCMRTLRSLVGD